MEDFEINKFKLGESFYIEASAGTGKTWTVMQIVKKLIESGISLDKILIVTYTEKAAGELKDRVRSELEKAIKEHKDNKDVKKKFEDALKMAPNAPIFTIHSFCQQTLAQSSFLASVPSGLDMIDESSVGELLEQKLRDVFIDSNEAKDFKYEDILAILNQKSGIRDILKSATEKYYLDKNGNEQSTIISLPENNNKSPSAKNYIYNKIKEIYKQWLIDKENDNKQTFNDMIRGMREAICDGKSTDKNLFVKYLRNKYTYAIIDEFQDTNQKQWDIFSTIFLGEKGKPVLNYSLIVVGDPKQSIYSFQGADVSVYNNAKKSGFANKGYRLSCNYRSSNKIIESCNYLIGGREQNKFFDVNQDENFAFTPSKIPNKDKQKIDSTYFVGKDKYSDKPIWLITNKGNNKSFVNEWEFADFAAKSIKNCCTKIKINNEIQTRLRVFDKNLDGKELRNVNYSDFTILYKQRSELEPIISALKKYNIPFTKYKDKGLFNGKECVDWVAILEAINADDFAEYKRKLLNKALFTNFFSVPITDIENPDFNYPNNSKRRIIQDWKNLAQSNNWLALVERIFEDTKIEERLNKEKKYDALARYRQIGAYIAEFLCKGDSTLSDCIEHLEALCDEESGEETQGDDGNIVELGTDSKCVKVMTIHASKGLEFPVVIVVGGFKARNNIVTHCWQGHKDNKLMMTIFNGKGDNERDENKIKLQSENEQDAEFKRLFYVAYTRASSLLILPYYHYSNRKKYYEFLSKRFAEMVSPDADNKKWVDEYVWCRNYNDKDEIDKKTIVQSDDFDKQKPNFEAEDARLKRLKTVKSAAKDLVTFKQSYSSLSKGKTDIYLVDKQDNNKSKLGDEFESISNDFVVVDEFLDLNSIQAEKNSDLSLSGAYFGSALHEIFEKADFEDFKLQNGLRSKEKLEQNSKLIKDTLLRYGLINSNEFDDISLKNKKIVEDMIYASMNAVLPKIRGSKGATNPEDILHLADISKADRLAETEFLFNAVKGKWYCNGFMDLVFRYKDGDDYRYCILDYKSDKLESPRDYVDMAKLKAKVDEEYSIQRVLYSYCLIKWLAAVYNTNDYEVVFTKYFGGIYYLLARGTEAEKQNGVYAHTWSSFRDLEKAHKNISYLKNVEEDE